MTQYEVGSIASFVSQKSSETKDKQKNVQKNQKVLDQLFSVSNETNPVVVANVPVPTAATGHSKKVKKRKRDVDQYKISNIRVVDASKKLQDLDEDEIKNILDEGQEDEFDNEPEEEEEKVSRKLKKNEMRNIKRNVENKGHPNADDDRVIMVKNLPAEVKRKTVHHFFARFGKINAVWLRCAALADPAMPKKVAVIKQEFHPDRKSISAFVRFEDADSARSAVSATGCEFQERHIAISLVSESHNRKNLGLGIFVGNLPFGVDDEDLWLHFGECGKINDVRVVRDRTNGMGKGFGYVNFQSADSVELALKLDQSLLNDRAIRVSRCKKNPKPFRSEDEKNPKENGKDAGAYKRIKNKETQKERQKGAGWITKMKMRNKESHHKQPKSHSFAGETTGSDSIKIVKKGKTIKRNKEEMKKKMVAAKLSSTKSKK